MSGTIFFFHGADVGASTEKVEAVRAKFTAQYGDTDIDVLDGVALKSAAELQALVETRPFFGVKRLVILRDLSAARSQPLKTEILKKLDRFREAPTVLVFHERRSFERRERDTVYFRTLSQEQYAFELTAPSPVTLTRKVTAALEREGVRVDPDAAALLAQALLSDLPRVHSELEKLVMFKMGDASPLTVQEVELLVRPGISSNVFALTDALGSKDATAIAREHRKLIANGDAGHRLLAMVVSHVRALLLARDALDAGGQQEAVASALAKELRMHPFVAKKAVMQARHVPRAELAALFHGLKELDVATKTGRAEVDGGMVDLLIGHALRA